jgi:hypothetical protein
MGNQQIGLGFRADSSGPITPAAGCARFFLDLFVGHVGGSFGFTKEFARAGFDYEVRFVSGLVGDINLEIVAAGFVPLQNFLVPFEDHGENTFGVHVETLLTVKTLFETAEEQLADRLFCWARDRGSPAFVPRWSPGSDPS